MYADTRLGRFTAIGTTDENTTCDCCGKSNLKLTVVLRDEDGEFHFYGRSCAARATGRKASLIERATLIADGKRAEAAARVERYTRYLTNEEALATFMDANALAFENSHGGMTRANAIAWLTTHLTTAQAEAALPAR